MQTILVAIDFSGSTQRVLDAALSIAQAFRAEVCLLHVVAPEPSFVSYEVGPLYEREVLAHEWREEREALADIHSRFEAVGLKTTSRFLRGPTSETILAEAKRRSADLIVLGSHGHGAIRELFMGSVSEGVVRRSTTPLLIVPIPSEK